MGQRRVPSRLFLAPAGMAGPPPAPWAGRSGWWEGAQGESRGEGIRRCKRPWTGADPSSLQSPLTPVSLPRVAAAGHSDAATVSPHHCSPKPGSPSPWAWSSTSRWAEGNSRTAPAGPAKPRSRRHRGCHPSHCVTGHRAGPPCRTSWPSSLGGARYNTDHPVGVSTSPVAHTAYLG